MIKNVCDHCEDKDALLRVSLKEAEYAEKVRFPEESELDLCLGCLRQVRVEAKKRESVLDVIDVEMSFEVDAPPRR
jgi:hypothetical protein